MATEPTAFDLDAYVERSRNGPCFVCEIVHGRDDASDLHQVLYRDDIAIAFFNRYPTMPGYTIVAPIEHREAVLGDFTSEEFLALQAVIHKVGRALQAVVDTERLYVLSLGSNQGNAHVHWHLAPLPPGVAYEDQQYRSLMMETAGTIDVPHAEREALAARIRVELRGAP
ncbi:MAG: HIT family protein [Acidimicrobiales bacterium]